MTGQGGAEIWLREDQRFAECLSRLGVERDSIPESMVEGGVLVNAKVYELDFNSAKALFCSHRKP